jgi:NitT/TauT family transport system substrate-binding protein
MRRFSALILPAFISCAVGASILFSPSLFAKPKTLATIALNWKAEPQFGGFYAARKFKLLQGGSGTPTVQMLANGKVDFAIVSAEEILISNQRNPDHPVVGVFAAFKTNPQMIMCHAEKGFKSLAEVFAAPVTLAWQRGLSYAEYLSRKYPSPKARTVPYLGGIGPFLHDVDFCQQGFITSEPLAARKAGAHVKTFLVAKEGFNPYTTVLAVRRDFLTKNSKLVKSVVEAARGGWKTYLKNPKPTNARMHALNRAMDLKTFAASAAAQKPLIQADGKMTHMRWSVLAESLIDIHAINRADPDAAFKNF